MSPRRPELTEDQHRELGRLLSRMNGDLARCWVLTCRSLGRQGRAPRLLEKAMKILPKLIEELEQVMYEDFGEDLPKGHGRIYHPASVRRPDYPYDETVEDSDGNAR